MSNFKEAGASNDESRFQEAGIEAKLTDTAGLPLLWDNLKQTQCPKCGDNLRAFEHLNLYKCVCGFKISAHKLEDILLKMENQEEEKASYYSGYGFSDYYSDSPF